MTYKHMNKEIKRANRAMIQACNAAAAGIIKIGKAMDKAVETIGKTDWSKIKDAQK